MSKRYKAKRRERYYRERIWDDPFTMSQGLDIGPCWCGETKPYYAPLGSCGGSGIIQCICGGDFCVCHWHGEVECFGCEDCEEQDRDDQGILEEFDGDLY